jgi:hypothetical protein
MFKSFHVSTAETDTTVSFVFTVSNDVPIDLNKITKAVAAAFDKAVTPPAKKGKKDEVPDAAAADGPAADSSEGEAKAAKPKARRSRKSSADTAAPDADATEAAPADSGSDGDDVQQEPAGGGRRRRRSASAGSPAERTEEAGEAKPASRRRRRSTPAPDAADEDAGAGEQDADEGKAREISDADLTGAASKAAAKITPKAVQDIIDEFGVSELKDLDAGQRVEFIDRMLEAAV